MRAQYEQLPVAAVLDLVRRAEPIAATAPLASWTEFVGGKAQALAMAGRERQGCDQQRAVTRVPTSKQVAAGQRGRRTVCFVAVTVR